MIWTAIAIAGTFFAAGLCSMSALWLHTTEAPAKVRAALIAMAVTCLSLGVANIAVIGAQ